MKKIVLIVTGILLSNSFVSASYKDNRYPTPSGFLRLLEQKFPSVFTPEHHARVYCLTDGGGPNKFDLRTLGLNDPATGEPTIAVPDQTYFNWYVSCMKDIIREDFDAVRDGFDTDGSRYIDSRIFVTSNSQLMLKPVFANPKDKVGNVVMRLYGVVPWGKFKPEIKGRIIQYLITKMIGPDVLSENENSQLKDRIQSTMEKLKDKTLYEALQEITLALTLTESFVMSPE